MTAASASPSAPSRLLCCAASPGRQQPRSASLVCRRRQGLCWRSGHPANSRVRVVRCAVEEDGRRPTLSTTSAGFAEYRPNAADKDVLRSDPNQRLEADEIRNVFDYKRNLSARYEIGDMLGAGSFGVVHRAVERATGREYAVKTINKVPRGQRSSSAYHLLKIRAEVDSMMQLGASLDAVYLRDVFENGSCVHLVMELCEGGSLMEVGRVGEVEAAELIKAVLRFLAQCHAKGVVYRDVKPGNFLFTSHDSATRRLKATDFGMAVLHSEDVDAPLTTNVGTPYYMAPEVIEGSYGAKADVYSAGVLAFQLLTGRYPYWPDMDFDKPGTKRVWWTIRKEEIDFSGLPAEGVPAGAQDLLQQLLRKDPAARPSAEAALRHPWLTDACTDGAAPGVPLSGTALQRLQRHAVGGHLKRVVLGMIAEELGAGELVGCLPPLEVLRELFGGSPQGNSVPKDALLDALTEAGYVVTDEELSQLLGCMGTDADGGLNFNSLASSLMDWFEVQQTEAWDRLLRHAFHRLDADGDGLLSEEEIAAALRDGVAGASPDGDSWIDEEMLAEAAHMLREFDVNGDGLISWEEFASMVSQDNAPAALGLFDRRLQDVSMCEPMWDLR
mmetsp:Transcript_24470/g.61631  ORF Transcript_24470/g.61631 Transcript_24470/m.61631 type:complete len:614 (+) Transcript_24470:75-1916(+)